MAVVCVCVTRWTVVPTTGRPTVHKRRLPKIDQVLVRTMIKQYYYTLKIIFRRMPNKKRRILECVNVHFLSRGMVSRLVCAGRMSGASRCQPSHTETSTAEPEPSRAGPSAAALRVPPSTCPSGSTFPYLWVSCCAVAIPGDAGPGGGGALPGSRLILGSPT